jgi:hypothetical protein
MANRVRLAWPAFRVIRDLKGYRASLSLLRMVRMAR